MIFDFYQARVRRTFLRFREGVIVAQNSYDCFEPF